MAMTATLGFPRIGVDRDLKKAVEAYWASRLSGPSLMEAARDLRRRHWQLQQAAGIDHIPSNDFSFYDHVLDTSIMLGVIPSRFGYSGGPVSLDTYFAMARGTHTAAPLEMTKWFDTNYHYLVPEFEHGQTFSLTGRKILDEFVEAQALGILTRPVLLGPISFLLLGKSKDPACRPIQWLEQILPVYGRVLAELAQHGAAWVQIDEPVMATDLSEEVMAAFETCYRHLCGQPNRPQLCMTSYFGDITEHFAWLSTVSFDALHLDLVRGPQQLESALAQIPETTRLSLGVVNGRNIWTTHLSSALHLVDQAVQRRGADRIIIAPSCSMLHCPIDLERETKLDIAIKRHMAFARQKLDELTLIQRAVENGRDSIAGELRENQHLFDLQKTSSLIHNPAVQARMQTIEEAMFSRRHPYPQRRAAQQEALALPPLPTTTIGSFPQTPAIRKARAACNAGTLTPHEYEQIMRDEIEKTIRFQDTLGLDVLVHGEPERNDMVEYFGQLLDGFAFTEHGWVQSYGSRCVKPPILYGDAALREPMTVRWASYAQSLTDTPVKGMLTGPITILQWSFVREDQPRKETAWQLGLCIRDEVGHLENAGIRVIQIDEPALREGVPLKKSEWPAYLDWAVKAFRLATSSVSDATQIHTHMCYCNFNDVMEAIAAMDADVISIEAARSDAELLNCFAEFGYPNEIGPGVYDIHSPRVPSVDEMKRLLQQMLGVLRIEQLWVNPDCGLKTRGWPEVEQSLKNMVAAARELRHLQQHRH